MFLFTQSYLFMCFLVLFVCLLDFGKFSHNLKVIYHIHIFYERKVKIIKGEKTTIIIIIKTNQMNNALFPMVKKENNNELCVGALCRLTVSWIYMKKYI